MSRKLTASDRRRLIRLASTMEKGSEGRRAILAGLSKQSRLHSPASPRDDVPLTSKQYMDAWDAGYEMASYLHTSGKWSRHMNGDDLFLHVVGQDRRVPDVREGDPSFWEYVHAVSEGGADYAKNHDLKGRFASGKTAARNDKRLAAALLKYLREIQDQSQKDMDGDPAWGRGGKYDPVSDVGVWVGKEAERMTQTSGRAPDVVLHYDGAGYDVFSDQGDYAYYGIRKHRDHVKKLGEKYGYFAEPLNNWSLGFWYEGR